MKSIHPPTFTNAWVFEVRGVSVVDESALEAVEPALEGAELENSLGWSLGFHLF